MVLLPFYKSYRALIRGKVEALRAGPSVASVRYFTIAGRQTWSPYKPFVVVVCGLTGSGKSTLARELSERVGIVVINSDVVRKELTGKSGRGVPFNRGIYSSAITERTYRKMFAETARRISQGQSVMLDATFAKAVPRATRCRCGAPSCARVLLALCRIRQPHADSFT